MKKLKDFLLSEKKSGKRIFPPGREIFTAFNLVSSESVKAVIIGQDPYHGFGQAHGLSFSVKKGQRMPPSLQNILKEIEADLGRGDLLSSGRGDLSGWAEQGVLLINSVLTVEEGHANSHSGKGWEVFTDSIIKSLNEKRQHIVYILWGKKAQLKSTMINRNNNLILRSSHPSPLSSYRGFFGCSHFSKCNDYLKSNGIEPINWSSVLV